MTKCAINGEPYRLIVEAEAPILWAVRDLAGKTVTKYGLGSACAVFFLSIPEMSPDSDLFIMLFSRN